MEAVINQITPEEAGPTLQIKRPLLPIDEYAARQGLSREAIEEYGWMGIVQIRKHKGRTFVVDVPLNSYSHISKPTNEPKETDDQTSRKQNLPAGRPARHGGQGLSQPIQRPRLKKPEITNPVTENTDKLTETKRAAQPDQTSQNNVRRFGVSASGPAKYQMRYPAPHRRTSTNILKALTGSKRTWQIAALLSLAFFSVALFANFRLNMDQKVQQNRLDQAYAGTQMVYNDLTQAKQQAEATQNELADARVELRRLRNELDKSISQAENTRNELAWTRQNFETIKQRYVEAIDQLNEKIQELTARLTELTTNL